MILKNFNECDHALHFFPLKKWPDVLPAVAWRNQLITGFTRRSGFVLNLESEPLHEVLLGAYGALNVFELARILDLSTRHNVELDFAALCLGSHLSWCDHLKETLIAVARLPLDVQHWCEEKSMAPRDVQIFRNFLDVSAFWSVFDFLQSTSASRQQSVEVLELFGDLLLMGTAPETLEPPAGSRPDLYLAQLRKLRNPMNQSAIENRNQTLKQLPWPKATQGQWTRRGDRLELEVRMTVQNGAELERRLLELQHLPRLIQ